MSPVSSAPSALRMDLNHVTHRADGGRIVIVLDKDAYDFHVDAHLGYSATVMASLLQELDTMGYILLDEEECEAEVLDNGAIRIYLTPNEMEDTA